MHTPGPWINCHTHVDDSRGLPLVVAAVKDFDRINCADFALIAAAPALLEALERIVNDSPEPGEDAVLTVEGYNQACNAIAAARGEGVKA